MRARAVLAVLLLSVPAGAGEASLESLVEASNLAAIRAMGPRVLPDLARLYTRSDNARKARVAYVFYNLGWRSSEAKQALMADVRTSDRDLRLQVQWALGRVSADPDVIDVLLDNMRHDAVPLFRDKAACALAYDQIHLAAAQKLRLYQGLVAALDDEEPQVRSVTSLALRILTGQTKGYVASASREGRQKAIESWQRWLIELEANL
jgi:integrase